ncbi:MAG: tyrosine-type recombinase/integrase [Cryomorphaceae bacterium]|nr:tyrosine-type recombinase/integrase [Cryomorphaceae bacterium]
MKTQEIFLFRKTQASQSEFRLRIPNSAIKLLSGNPLFTKRRSGYWILPGNEEVRRTVLDLFTSAYHIHEYADEDIFLETHISKTELQNASAKNAALDDAIFEFAEWLEKKGYKVNTVSSYESLVRPFFKHFPDQHFRDIRHLHYLQFEEEKLINKEFSISYKRQLINALRLFSACFGDRFHFNLHEVPMPHREDYSPEALSLLDFQSMIKGTADLKQRTILACLYNLGLRTSELVNIRICDIDYDYQNLKIQSDGKVNRRLRCSDEMLRKFDQYLNEFSPSYYLFESRDGVRYTERRIQQICSAAAINANVKRKVSPAVLRQSMGVHLLRKGVDVKTVQKMLGHRHLKSTERYTYGITA